MWFGILVTTNPSSPRHAYVQNLLQEAVADGVTGLKKHGAADKLDNCTCLFCFAPPDTYHDPASLENNALFEEVIRLLGVSSMHLKVRCGLLKFPDFVSCQICEKQEQFLDVDANIIISSISYIGVWIFFLIF